MFIQTEDTPNPLTLKFLPGVAVMTDGTAFIDSAADAARSPLARQLFAIEGVTAVYYGADFVSVSKSEAKPWIVLKPIILGTLMDHFTAGTALFDAPVADDAAASGEDDDEVVGQIKELLDQRVRPVVARDGGDIRFHGFQDGVVYLTMQGACAGCPSSAATLQGGIENLLKHYVPEVVAVRAVA